MRILQRVAPLDRSKLESAVRRGVVLVRVDGCTARIADGCSAKRRYEYSPTSRQREVMTVRDRDELGAKLPLGAVRFAASMEASSALDVAMTVVGRYESEASPVAPSDLEGPCEGVTHVVANVSVGAFAIREARGQRVQGNATALVGGARAETAAERRHLDSAGVDDHCAEARRTDTAPPDGCGIPLRLELRPLGRVRRVIAEHDVPGPLASCAVDRVQRIGFPQAASDRPRVYVVPFVFNRTDTADDP